MAKLCPLNFNKRINWQKQINTELSSKIKLLSYTASSLEEENVKLKKGLDNAYKDKTKLSKSNSYLKKINKGTYKKTQLLIKMLLSLNFRSYDYIAFLENHEGVLEEKVAELSSEELSFFKNNMYSNKIYSMDDDLLCFGVGIRNVLKALQIVLKKLAGVTCDWLPKATFSKDMLMRLGHWHSSR